MTWIVAVVPFSHEQRLDFWMSSVVTEVILGGFFRLGLLAVGGMCFYLGYRLFLHSPIKEAGDLSAKWGGKEFFVKRGAPGTFFALFGATIIVFGIVHGGSATQAITGGPEFSPQPVVGDEPVQATIYEHASTSPVRTFETPSIPPATSPQRSGEHSARAPSAQ